MKKISNEELLELGKYINKHVSTTLIGWILYNFMKDTSYTPEEIEGVASSMKSHVKRNKVLENT